jgi:asparagine synthase (glutamine-hydrolysing)
MELHDGVYHRWYDYVYPIVGTEEKEIMKQIRKKFIAAVDKRLMSDRPIGCLLSGGLDSSLVTALVARKYPRGTLKSFSVGLEGSEDLKFARMVAAHCGTDHHEIVLTEEVMLEALEDDVQYIECYDTTTIRASTPMYLMSKYIKEKTDVTVIYSGEGSDEASGSYMYFHKAPTPEAFQKESVRLMEDLCYFDVLRCDKSTAGAGLEVRVPFLDKEFLQYYLGIDPKLKMPATYGIEKYLLRKSFDYDDLLPKEVLWRVKEGMSDGVSSKTKSWYEII